MKQNLIAAIVCAALLNVPAVNAQTIILSKTSGVITVTDEMEPDSDAMMIAVREGESIDNNDQIYAIRYSVADENGTASFSFEMPEQKNGMSVNGVYDIYTKQSGKNLVKGKLVYASPESREEMIAEIKKAADAEELKKVINDAEKQIVLQVLGCDLKHYLALDNKDFAVSDLFEYIKGIPVLDNETFPAAFNAAVAVSGINVCNQDTVSEYLKSADLSFEGSTYSELKDEKLSAWIDKCIYKNREYSNVAELENAYNEANSLYIVNSTRVDDIKEVLAKYETMLNISQSVEYKEYLNASGYEKINEKIVTALKLTPASSAEELRKTIKNAMTVQESGTGGGGSGGGSSGGSHTGGSSSAPGITSAVPSVGSQEEKSDYFKDLKQAQWAEKAINIMAEKGVVSGDENGNFRPNDTIKREEFVKILVMAAGVYDENAECDFSDAEKSAWYYRSVASAFNAGLVYGISEDEFGIGADITRQDMMVLCMRAADKVKTIEAVRENNVFDDEEEIGSYAREAVSKLYMAGVVNGMDNNMFCPLSTATRAQGALVIYNLFFK